MPQVSESPEPNHLPENQTASERGVMRVSPNWSALRCRTVTNGGTRDKNCAGMQIRTAPGRGLEFPSAVKTARVAVVLQNTCQHANGRDCRNRVPVSKISCALQNIDASNNRRKTDVNLTAISIDG